MTSCKALTALLVLMTFAEKAAAEVGTSTDSAACCQLTTSLANNMTEGQDKLGDESFFMQEGAPPNLHFLVDTSGSMMELPYVRASNHYQFWTQTVNGCENPVIDAHLLARGWNPAVFYPPPDPGTGIGSDNGYPNLFQPSATSLTYYAYMTWQDSTNPTPQWTNPNTACSALHVGSDEPSLTKHARCVECLNTKGYYRNPGYTVPTSSGWENGIWTTSSTYNDERRHFIFSGNFLNFNPPKYVTMKRVLKEIIADLRRVRMGYTSFDSTGGANGGTLRQPQNPSCDQILKDGSSFDSNRASYISGINGLDIRGGTPLAEAVFNIGQYFSSSDKVYTDKFKFNGSEYLKSSFRNGMLTSQGRSWCWGCQVSSVVILTDGDPSGDNRLVDPERAVTPAYNIIKNLNGKAITCEDGPDLDSLPDCPDGEDYKLDDVTYFLSHQDLQQNTPVIVGDLNTAGKQSLLFYGIGFGVSSPVLMNAVREEIGGGFYREAYDAASLKAAILEVISSVETRATSFAASSVSSLQINKTGGSILPRFKPSRSGINKPWEGFLYRFDLGRETLDGCKEEEAAAAADAGTEYALDRNANGSCSDYNLVDADGKMTLENDDGAFVHFDDPLRPAQEFWEAGEVLKNGANAPYVWRSRSIWTVIDNSTGAHERDNKYDANDTPIEFTEDNAERLLPYLGIGSDPMGCADVAKLLDPADVDGMDPVECARAIIRWVRGANAFSADLTERDMDRPFLLHDIFHSSPILVHAPVPTGTELLTNYQQLQTLSEKGYGKTTNSYTPFQEGYEVDGRKVDAWEAFLHENAARDELILVGSNGGMLHAFHAGSVNPDDPYDATTGTYKHDYGTGEELWAFIPPDLLPRLRRSLGKHTYMVDGSAMVREAWFDTNDDNVKQKEEFRTVVVMNEGVGGVHRFALDITQLIPRNRSFVRTGERFQQGDFLWLWPQPCDDMALKVGRSISEFFPKPPPIGPIRVLDEDGREGPVHGGAEERWVTFLNGGYDQYLTRGRGVAMVDLRTGSTLWKFWHGEGERQKDFRYPTTAAVAMVDVGALGTDTSEIDEDLFFDTANIGDYGGTLWTFRFHEPALLKRDGGKLVLDAPQWFGARAFRTKGATEDSVRAPFAYIVDQAWQYEPRRLRVFLGSGDRMHLQDTGGPRCRLSNPLACAQLGCVVRNTTTVTRNGTRVAEALQNFSAHALTDVQESTGSASNACVSSSAKVTWDYDSANGCSNNAAGSMEMTCSNVAGEGFRCRTSIDNWSVMNVAETPPAASPDRFYGVYVFGEDTSRRFDTEAEAAAYHASYLTEGSPRFIRIDDTTGTYASELDYGWYWTYGPADERTGSQATLVGQSVLWSSFLPSGQAAVCSTTGTNIAHLIQANFITGKPDSADAFYDETTGAYVRKQQYTTVAVPPPPAAVWTIEGAFSSSGVILTGPGVTAGYDVTSSSELFQSLYQLEVDRSEHQCRHENDPGACAP